MPPETLDQKLARFLRLQRGTMTFAQFSRKLSLAGATLHRIENGQQSATLRIVQQICRALRCDYEDIFGDPARLLRAAETPLSEKPADAIKPPRGASYKTARRKK